MNNTTLHKLSQNPHYKMSDKQLEELGKLQASDPYFDKHPQVLKLHDYEPYERKKKRDANDRSQVPVQDEAPKNGQTNKL